MKSNITQIIILGIFILSLIIGVLLFAMYKGSSQGTVTEQVEIWGFIPEDKFALVLDSINTKLPQEQRFSVVYRTVSEKNFEQTLIEALADGVGPDAVLIPNTSILKNQKKFLLISNDTLSERDFRDTFAESGEVFLTPSGTYALPVLSDPMVMYWNRDILTSKSIARPPTTWEEVIALSEILTQRREDKSIIKSTVALGDYSNITFAKNILMTLLMQAGGTLVLRNADGLAVSVSGSADSNSDALTNTLSFYTQFSDPLKPIYSWNRSLVNSEQAFLNGDLAFYFAPASEASIIREKNPNLNFDIATMPQPKNSVRKTTSSIVYGFAILSSSKKAQSAYNVLKALISSNAVSEFSNLTGLPPVRRDLLSTNPGNAFGGVFWQSSLWAKAWLDPNPLATDIIFRNAVDSIVSGKDRVDSVSKIITSQISELLR